MAKCPGVNCKVEWQWDWCMDHYRNKKTGDFCIQTKEQKYKVEEAGKEIELSVFICTECKTVISVQVLDHTWGCEIFNHPMWGRLDWQAKINCYPDQ